MSPELNYTHLEMLAEIRRIEYGEGCGRGLTDTCELGVAVTRRLQLSQVIHSSMGTAIYTIEVT